MWEELQRLLYGKPQSVLAPPVPPLSGYPSREDAEYARDYGFGYGSGNEGYVQGQTARVIGQPEGKLPIQSFIPRSSSGMTESQATGSVDDDKVSRNLDLTRPGNAAASDAMGTTLAQAALAVNRMPVAALGFDPSRAAFDVTMQNPTIGGLYDPNNDNIWATIPKTDPSAVVHESAHRGIRKLREDPALVGIFKNLPTNEEDVVRYLMAKQAGDPEGKLGEEGAKQRKKALRLFDTGLFNIGLKQLDEAAAEAIKKRRPGGPR